MQMKVQCDALSVCAAPRGPRARASPRPPRARRGRRRRGGLRAVGAALDSERAVRRAGRSEAIHPASRPARINAGPDAGAGAEPVARGANLHRLPAASSPGAPVPKLLLLLPPAAAAAAAAAACRPERRFPWQKMNNELTDWSWRWVFWPYWMLATICLAIAAWATSGFSEPLTPMS